MYTILLLLSDIMYRHLMNILISFGSLLKNIDKFWVIIEKAETIILYLICIRL